jgi:porphobilinogen deaminase
MDKPTQQHNTAAKRVLRYISSTIAHGIWYKPVKNSKLIGYTDSDWAGCQEDMKSTSGYVFSLGSGVVSWSTKKQSIVALSSAEAEYVAAARAAAQAIWLRRILRDVYTDCEEPIGLYSDSKAAIAISENPISHDRTKHIAIKYHYTREAVDKKEIQLIYCSSEDQKADMFTKILTRTKYEKNRQAIGVVENSLRS